MKESIEKNETDSQEEDPLRSLNALLQELWQAGDCFLAYFQARLELAQLSVKEVLEKGFFGILKTGFLSLFLMLAIGFLLYGTAIGLGEALKAHWLGFVITGFASVAIVFFLVAWRRLQRKRAFKKFKESQEKLNELFLKKSANPALDILIGLAVSSLFQQANHFFKKRTR